MNSRIPQKRVLMLILNYEKLRVNRINCWMENKQGRSEIGMQFLMNGWHRKRPCFGPSYIHDTSQAMCSKQNSPNLLRVQPALNLKAFS